MQSIYVIFLCVFSRYGESRGPGAGRARLSHALPPGVPRVPPWDDEAVLEEGARWKTYLRIHPVLFGRLLHSHRATVPAGGQPLVWGIWGANSGIIQRHISGDQSSGWRITSANGRSLDEAAEKEVLMLQTSPQPHWCICKCETRMFSEVEVCPLCTRGPNVWGSVQLCRSVLVR